jgi:hypothetical protein
LKNLSSRENKTIAFNEFLKAHSIFKMAFYIESDHSPDPILFYYAHWTMSLSTLQFFAKNMIRMSRELKTFYASYMNATATHEKRIAFNHFLCAYQDFNGYLMSV